MKHFFLLSILFLTACTVQEPVNEESFCGTSTNGSCSSNSECITAGCSGQICQSSSEEERISTCEYRECYDKTKYSLSCSCKENQCQWA